MQTIAVAAISARAMAEAAARDGYAVVALDLFGDVDTRRAAAQWLPIGTPGSLRIDPERVMAALQTLAQQRAHGAAVLGWVAGSGFEGMPELLAAGAAVLPLIGTAPDAVRRVRDPAAFFAFLAGRAMPFPQVRLEPPEDPRGWLLKDAHGCGGWHVGAAPWALQDLPSAHHYVQREMAGQPMSATFLANGQDVCVLGFNLLTVRGFDARPFVFCGIVGPVPVPPDMARRVRDIARALTVQFGLQGLCSLDFMRDGDAIGVLEVNPRPPASMALYQAAVAPTGLMRAHLQACLQGTLPSPPTAATDVAGFEIVFARQPLMIDPALARHLAGRPDLHDLPDSGQYFDVGDPVCTVSARGAQAGQVRALLNERRERLLQSLETTV